ncbi:MAG: substrate-binding domain-containing protein [Candidatus Methylacidiphilales bacterium]|nr:substrate-binding domain-containing protein [Candidatus Methylacidiphilales bacterium]
MTASSKKATVKLSFSDKDRAISLLRTLARLHYFGASFPSEAELSRLLRIPRSSLALGFANLEAERLIHKADTGLWQTRAWLDQKPLGQVGFVVNTDILKGWYSLFQDWLTGFEHTMSDEGYETVLLSNFASCRDKIEKIALQRERGLMGLALASRTEPEVLEYTRTASIPSVLLGNANIHHEGLGCVCSDNRAGMEKLIDHLVQNNHRDIAFYGVGLSFHEGYRERLASYQNSLRQYGLEPHTEWIFPEPHHELCARRAAEIYQTRKTKPTAFVCATDREAFELVAEFRHMKIEVPRDVSVAGYDNNHFAHMLEPAMTTVDIYAFEMGRVAANYLLNEMQAAQLPVKILLPADLVVRMSVSTLSGKEADRPSRPVQPPVPVEIVSF